MTVYHQKKENLLEVLNSQIGVRIDKIGGRRTVASKFQKEYDTHFNFPSKLYLHTTSCTLIWILDMHV